MGKLLVIFQFVMLLVWYLVPEAAAMPALLVFAPGIIWLVFLVLWLVSVIVAAIVAAKASSQDYRWRG